jgi:hypothetical protein
MGVVVSVYMGTSLMMRILLQNILALGFCPWYIMLHWHLQIIKSSIDTKASLIASEIFESITSEAFEVVYQFWL